MNRQSQPECPRTLQLSALIDDELGDDPRAQIANHAASCPLCGAMLRDLSEQRAMLRSLAGECPGIDLVRSIGRRLEPRRSPRRPAAESRWWHRWRLAPSGLGAAGALALGLYFGALLAGGAGVTAMRPAAMAAFDAVPPGGICVGLQSCYAPGR